MNEKNHRYLPAAVDWQMSVIGVGSSFVAKRSVGWKKNGPLVSPVDEYTIEISIMQEKRNILKYQNLLNQTII